MVFSGKFNTLKINMSVESEDSVENSSALPVGYVDIFVFSSFLGLLLYWFLVKKRKHEEVQVDVSGNG